MTLPPARRVIDDLSRNGGTTPAGPRWELVTDGVMGGMSQGFLRRETVAGRPALRLQGTVSLANNGGFVQMALDLAPEGGVLDASRFEGIVLDVYGNGEAYSVHLRTPQVTRPWQSWRHTFVADRSWQSLRLPFAAFVPHRIEGPLDPARLRRMGLVAIGRAFDADLSLGFAGFY